MNATEQKRFVKELVESIENTVISLISSGDIPDEWDGHELRWYLSDKFSDAALIGSLDKNRKKRYKNALLINNL